MTPGAWESGRGNHFCPESVENLPGNRAEDFRIPESLTKENYIFKKKKKKLFKGLALYRGRDGGVRSLMGNPRGSRGDHSTSLSSIIPTP